MNRKMNNEEITKTLQIIAVLDDSISADESRRKALKAAKTAGINTSTLPQPRSAYEVEIDEKARKSCLDALGLSLTQFRKKRAKDPSFEKVA